MFGVVINVVGSGWFNPLHCGMCHLQHIAVHRAQGGDRLHSSPAFGNRGSLGMWTE